MFYKSVGISNASEVFQATHPDNCEISRTSVMVYHFRLGTIHKGRLLKGVGRWVHQKEIYYIRLFSKNRRQG